MGDQKASTHRTETGQNPPANLSHQEKKKSRSKTIEARNSRQQRSGNTNCFPALKKRPTARALEEGIRGKTKYCEKKRAHDTFKKKGKKEGSVFRRSV